MKSVVEAAGKIIKSIQMLKNWIKLILIAFPLTTVNAQKDLFLIAGTPLHETGYPHYMAAIFHVQGDSLSEVLKLNDGNTEVRSIRHYFSDDLVIIETRDRNRMKIGLIGIPILRPLDTLRSSFIVPTGYELLSTYFRNEKNNPEFLYELFNPRLLGAKRNLLVAYSLKSKTYDTLSTDAYQTIFLNGYASSGMDGNDVMPTYTSPKNSKMFIPVTEDVSMRPTWEYMLPTKYWFEDKKRISVIQNSREAFVLERFVGETSSMLIFNKMKKEWSELSIKGSALMTKPFGDWMAGSVCYDLFQKDFVVTPGIENRNSTESKFGVGADRRFKWNHIYYSGTLYIYNITDKQYIEWEAIEGNLLQGDSEVLLITGNVLFYRVNDKIFRADIVGSRITNQILVVEDFRVRDIHWAFVLP